MKNIGRLLLEFSLLKPITFISKTLTKTEQLYATNKKELLAIVWAF